MHAYKRSAILETEQFTMVSQHHIFTKMQTISRSKRTNPLLLLRYAPPWRIVSNNYLTLNFFYGFVFAPLAHIQIDNIALSLLLLK